MLFVVGAIVSNRNTSTEEPNDVIREISSEETYIKDTQENHQENNQSNHRNNHEETMEQEGKFAMHFIDVGQGDATLVECDGEYMLIDAGDVNKGTTVQLYLTKQNVPKLNYVVGTHPDADHIGGMDVILTKYDCDTILMTDKTSDSKAYREVMDVIEYRNYKVTVPKTGDTFRLGSALCTVLGPVKNNNDDNNSSIVLKIQYGDTSFLLSGDAEEDEEQEIIDSGADLKADVYHAGHHGSRTASSAEWNQFISPDAVVISCGAGNAYGHPHEETLAAFRQMGVDVYRTDEQGSIVVSSDGKQLTWNCDAVQTQTVVEHESEEISSDTTYIVNRNTRKFHNPSCSSVSDIKPENKMEVIATREEMIDMGYDTCKKCNP